ncbi:MULTISPECIES: hypothetical protein [Mycobacterium]|uniref:Tryptophan synthase beta chain n=1 Tax=Mycobacterium indicus pranii (strain DSM 45239 / MTCC 9506) TaxID=1232724 RepID=J9WJI7_MYCIP|nr:MULTISPECIES: hypothetical protein [Mycobacterium]AFS15421.1 Tryptophan synthase beta chain [Mycobacterium intracellulare subsp. intracellulare MTCC 9506]WSE53131.1 hypothetical protein QGN31_08820 [Mycobacterium sp. 2-64]BCO52984.1 hypothetical protein MINTM003_34250 [Mycobacterium paraintracellulare]BCO84950.1 hypothetical protein MINTM011_32850 [Mycobacterium paraintracellulare]BCO90252.1 hypothetical protein MINTM015_35090 [Mycobacterium paraintracellulare]
MSDPDAEAVERWLDELDPDDPTVRIYDVEALSHAARQLEHAVSDALARGVPARIIRMTTDLLEDRLSVLLRTGETIPAAELRDKLGLRDDDGDIG